MMSPDKALNYLKELRNMIDYRYSPISVILAFPEREVVE